MLAAIPIFIVIGNIGNLKKHTNILDVFSIVLFFVYLYFAIADPQVYTILIPCLLLAELIMRIIFYNCEQEEVKNASNLFYAHLNYRFPIVVMLVLGIGLAFGGYYIIENGSEQLGTYFKITLSVCSTIVPLCYLALVSIIEHRELHFLDYIYFVLCVYMVGTVLLFYPQGDLLFSLVLPYLILCIRAHTYEGSFVSKKKKYVSYLLDRYHPIAVFIIGFGLSYLLAFTSQNALFDLHQNIYLALIAGVCVILCILLFVIKDLKARSIKPIDYLFFLLSSILFFTLIYVLSVALDLYGVSFRKSFFEDMITLISLFVLLICTIVFLILYFIRYKNFFKAIEEETTSVEEAVREPEAIEPTDLEATPEQIVDAEAPIVEEPVEEEPAPVEEEKEEVPLEEEIEDAPTEEETEEPIEEGEPEAIEEPEQEPVPSSAETIVDSGAIQIVIPDDESQNHLTKVKYLGKLMFSDEKLKNLYSEVKNYLLSYGATSRIASTKETFKKKGTLAVIRLTGKTLSVYLAILPEPFLEENYHIKDMQGVKQYEETPTMIKIKTKRSLKEFKEIVDVMMIHRDIKKKAHYKKVDYEAELIPNGEAILNA